MCGLKILGLGSRSIIEIKIYFVFYIFLQFFRLMVMDIDERDQEWVSGYVVC